MARKAPVEDTAVETPEVAINNTVTPKLDGLTVGVYRVRVETGKMTFSPVSYNSFDVGGVTIETAVVIGPDNPGAMQQALEQMREIARQNFATQYRQRLEFYIKALRYNDKFLADAVKQYQSK